MGSKLLNPIPEMDQWSCVYGSELMDCLGLIIRRCWFTVRDLGHIIQYLHFLKFNFGHLDLNNSDPQQLTWKREEILKWKWTFPPQLCVCWTSALTILYLGHAVFHFLSESRQMFEWSSVYERTVKFVCRMAHRHFLEWVFFSEEISLRARNTSLFLGNTP